MKKGVSNVMVTGIHVPELFDLAMVRKKLVVNRHYQRKLCFFSFSHVGVKESGI